MPKVIAALAALALAAPAQAADIQIGANGILHLNGEPTFLIGLSGPPPIGGVAPDGSDGWAEVAGAGVRMYRYVPQGDWSDEKIAEASAFLDTAHAYGGVVWLGLRELAAAQPGDERDLMLRRVVPALAGHPGMGIWRGVDEPWWSGVRPAEVLAHAYATLKELDPATPLHTIQAARGTHADLAPYSSYTDIHGADPYPVNWSRPNPDLHMVARWTRLMRDITPSRAVVMTLASCHGGSWNRPHNTLFRQPTLVQNRYMIYTAITNGARGLNFYGGNGACRGPGDAELGWNWTYWFAALRPVLREIMPGAPLHDALVRPGTGAGLRVSYGATVVSRRTETDLWVIASRHAAGAGKRTIRVSGLPSGYRTGKVYGKPRWVAARGGAFQVRLRQWGVQVLRFPLAG